MPFLDFIRSTCRLSACAAVLCLLGCGSGDPARVHPDVSEYAPAPQWEPGQEVPLIAMHYMPWFNNPNTSERAKAEWSHWAWSGSAVQRDPTRLDADGRREIASVHYPLIGPYSSDNRNVVRYHFETAKAAGIDLVFVIWYGPGSDTDQLVPMLLDEAGRAGLRLAICYEEKLNWPPYRQPKNRDEIVRTAGEDLQYLLEHYADHPAYLYRGEEPFIYQFNYWGEGALGKQNLLPEEWSRIFETLSRPITYARQNLNPEYHPQIEGAYVWWTPDDSYLKDFSEFSRDLVDAGRLDFFMTMVAPGFDDSAVNGWGHGARVTPRDGVSILRKTFEQAFLGSPEVVQLVTWNDFNEGTALEPTLEEGYLYLDALETWIGEQTGRAVDLEDNRRALKVFLEQAEPAQRKELPEDVERYL